MAVFKINLLLQKESDKNEDDTEASPDFIASFTVTNDGRSMFGITR